MNATNDSKGYARVLDIPADYLRELNLGLRASRTLPEALAVDFVQLFAAVLPDAAPEVRAQLATHVPITQRLARAGALLAAHCDDDALSQLATHTSDTVRGAVAYAIAATPITAADPISVHIACFVALADDPHFGVREWAWLALRPALHLDVRASIAAMVPYTAHASHNVRRFAVEALRPRGVWCKHLEPLKKNPEQARALLEPLRAEPHEYPQDSVANWLNDAAKTQPEWVHALCTQWLQCSPDAATQRIAKRALRSL